MDEQCCGKRKRNTRVKETPVEDGDDDEAEGEEREKTDSRADPRSEGLRCLSGSLKRGGPGRRGAPVK